MVRSKGKHNLASVCVFPCMHVCMRLYFKDVSIPQHHTVTLQWTLVKYVVWLQNYYNIQQLDPRITV